MSFKTMKATWIAFLILFLGGVAAKAEGEFKFDGSVYVMRWEARTNNTTIKEFLTGNETTNTWKTMITLQAHPKATKVKDVSGPYFEARKSLIAVPPKAHLKRKDDLTDVVLEFFLGAPGKTSHMEFALIRFIETDSGVYTVAYSQRFPLGKSKNQNINVDVVMKNKEKWIQQLLEIPVETIKHRF